jgi:hypothetical protein
METKWNSSQIIFNWLYQLFVYKINLLAEADLHLTVTLS